MNIFDDADDMAWYTNALLSDIVDNHAPVKSKFVKKQSVPYIFFQMSGIYFAPYFAYFAPYFAVKGFAQQFFSKCPEFISRHISAVKGFAQSSLQPKYGAK